MKKAIALLLILSMIATTLSVSLVSVSADTSIATTEGITEDIFTETFENYEKDVNWLDNITSNYVTPANTGVTAKDWYISSSRLGATDAEIMVVDATTEGIEADGVDRGQVLKINGGNTGKTILSVRRTFENEPELGKNSSGKITYADFTEKSKGKKFVYEVEYFTPADFYTGEAHFMNFSTSKDPGQYSQGTGAIYAALSGKYNHIFAKTGDNDTTYGTRLYQNFDDRGKWHTLKVVADFSEQSRADYWNTSRVYYDGKLLTATYKAKNSDTTNIITPDAPYEVGDRLYDYASTTPPTATTPYPARFSSVYGMLFSAVNNASKGDGKAVYYINNFKAYWVDELAVVSKENAEDFESGDIKLNFNSKINDSITKYAPAHSTSVTQSRYKESDKVTKSLSDLVTIVDNNNNLVDGAVLSVALENDDKTLKVTPDVSKLAGGATYKIALHPLFSDEYGQAFTDSTTSYPKTKYVEFTTKNTDFVANADKSVVSEAMGSANANVTVALSNIVTEADLENAFVLTNTKTDEIVTENWTYTLSADGKEVSVDFSELAPGSYKLTMNQITASSTGKVLVNASDIVVIVTILDKLATEDLFNETFEDYEKDVNWIDNLSGDFVTSTNTGVKENDWYIASKFTGATDAKVMVVDAGEKNLEADGIDRGNILMIDGGNTGTTMLSLQKTVNTLTNAGTVANNNIAYGKLIEEGSKGRKLVYEVDFYRPTDFYTGEAHFMTNSAGLAPAQYGAGGSGFYTSLSAKYTDYIITTGDSNYTYYARAQRDYDNRGAWHNMKVVVDYSAGNSATYWNTARVYIDDVLVTAKYTVKETTDRYVVTPDAPYELEDIVYDFAAKTIPEATRPYPAKGNFYGWTFSAKNSTSYDGKAVYYLDNFKAYWIDSLKTGEVINGDNYVSGEIEIPFNSEIKENVKKFDVVKVVSKRSYLSENNITTKNYKDLIYVVDERGNVIENALSNIRLSDNKRSLIVTPDMNVLWGGRKYKIAIDPLFTDVFGQAFTGNTTSQPKTTYVTFTTAKNNNLSIFSASNADLSVAGKVSATLELVNAADAPKSAFLALAVYNKNYEMIGISTQDVTVGAKGNSPVTLTVDIGDYTNNDVAYVKAHLWTSFEDMAAYQAAENIGL